MTLQACIFFRNSIMLYFFDQSILTPGLVLRNYGPSFLLRRDLLLYDSFSDLFHDFWLIIYAYVSKRLIIKQFFRQLLSGGFVRLAIVNMNFERKIFVVSLQRQVGNIEACRRIWLLTKRGSGLWLWYCVTLSKNLSAHYRPLTFLRLQHRLWSLVALSDIFFNILLRFLPIILFHSTFQAFLRLLLPQFFDAGLVQYIIRIYIRSLRLERLFQVRSIDSISDRLLNARSILGQMTVRFQLQLFLFIGM